jgi:hypothetical protein
VVRRIAAPEGSHHREHEVVGRNWRAIFHTEAGRWCSQKKTEETELSAADAVSSRIGDGQTNLRSNECVGIWLDDI